MIFSVKKLMLIVVIVGLFLGLGIRCHHQHLQERAAFHAKRAEAYRELSRSAKRLADMAAGKSSEGGVYFMPPYNVSPATIYALSRSDARKAKKHERLQREYENRWW